MPPEIKVKRRKLSDYTLDPENPNMGSERGASMLETSIEKFGPARSAVADQTGIIRAGNHTIEQLMAAKITDVIEVETTGRELVIVKRADMTPEQGKEYAVADNRTGQFIGWDTEVLQSLQGEGADIAAYFTDQELDNLIKGLDELPGFDLDGLNENGDKPTEGAGNPSSGGEEKYPLAIVLAKQDHERWKAYKEREGIKNDTDALLRLMKGI